MRWEQREIKSFRLRYRIANLKNGLNATTAENVFVTLNNVSASGLKKGLQTDNLSITAVSQKAVKLICKGPQTTMLQNSLRGNVYHIHSRNKQAWNPNTLLTTSGVNLQLLIANKALYRNTQQILDKPTSKNILVQFYQGEIVKLLSVLEFLKAFQPK